MLAHGAPPGALEATTAALEACVSRVRVWREDTGLHALRAALAEARAPTVLVARAAFPAPPPERLLALLALAPEPEGADAVVPRGPDGPDPSVAVYRRRILPVVDRCLREDLDLERLLDQIDALLVDESALPGATQ